MAALHDLEKAMSDVFVKKAPPLPDGGKKFLVDVAPWLSLIGGILGLFAALGLWNAARVTNGYVDMVNELNAYYGTGVATVDNLNMWVWLSLAVLLVQSVISLMAFPKLRERAKRGWDLLFYSALVSVVYNVVYTFTWQGNVGSLIFGLLFSALGFYLLFQIREKYGAAKAAHSVSAGAPKNPDVK